MSQGKPDAASMVGSIQEWLRLKFPDIAFWCRVKQPAITKWVRHAKGLEHTGYTHGPTPEHLDLLSELYLMAASVRLLQIDPVRTWEMVKSELEKGASRAGLLPKVVKYICAHADRYPNDDSDRAQADLRVALAIPDPDEIHIVTRRSHLDDGVLARCYSENEGAPRSYVVLVSDDLPDHRFREEALREIQAHVLHLKPTADSLPVEPSLEQDAEQSQPKILRSLTDVEHQSLSSTHREAGYGYRSWVMRRSNVATDAKRAIARHVATHILAPQWAVSIASGTTENSLMDEIINNRVEDLQILTNNLQVLAKGRSANLGSMSITLTGGLLNDSIDSLIGPDTAKVITDDRFMPHAVFFGAAGLSFVDGLSIVYAFQDEEATQVAYATRPTVKRVLMIDHTKLGHIAGRRAPLTIESMLASAQECYVVSSFEDTDQETIEREAKALRKLLEPLATKEAYDSKDFIFRLVDAEGALRKEYSLRGLRNRTW